MKHRVLIIVVFCIALWFGRSPMPSWVQAPAISPSPVAPIQTGSPKSITEKAVSTSALWTILRAPTPLQRATGLLRTKQLEQLSQWSLEDVRELTTALTYSLRDCDCASSTSIGDLLEKAGTRYAQLDPTAALLWAKALRGPHYSTYGVLPKIYAVLAHRDLHGTLSRIETTESPGRAAELRRQMFAELYLDQPERYLAMAVTESWPSVGFLRAAAEKLPMAELWRIIQAQPDSPGKLKLSADFMTETWHKPGGLEILSAEAKAGRLRTGYLGMYELKDADADRVWAASFGELPIVANNYLGNEALRTMLRSRGISKSLAAPGWADSEEHRHYLWDTLTQHLSDTASRSAHADRWKEMLASVPQPLHAELCRGILDARWNGWDGNATALWKLASASADPTLMAHYAQRYSQLVPKKAKAWMDTLTDSKVRDWVQLPYLARAPVSEALAMLPRFQDPAAKLAATKTLAVAWGKKDAPAAQRWLATQRLPAAELTAIQQGIRDGNRYGFFNPQGQWQP